MNKNKLLKYRMICALIPAGILFIHLFITMMFGWNMYSGSRLEFLMDTVCVFAAVISILMFINYNSQLQNLMVKCNVCGKIVHDALTYNDNMYLCDSCLTKIFESTDKQIKSDVKHETIFDMSKKEII